MKPPSPNRAYLDYYGSQRIIPVRQDIRDLSLHVTRRTSLYRHLGILPGAFRKSRVLEFGPGAGDNAVAVLISGVQAYVMVDGNLDSIRSIENKIERGVLPSECTECHHCNILEYRDDRRFEIVLCEGVIPGQEDPTRFLTHVSSFAGPDGIVVITTVSPTSLLAEVCRRILLPVLRARFPEAPCGVSEMVEFFAPDLRSLPGMNRLHEDWVLDNIFHPWPKRCTFSIPEAIDTLSREFEVLGTSPSFIQDWRWYKSISTERGWNDIAKQEFGRWACYLLDYRVQPQAPGLVPAAELEEACAEVLKAHNTICCNHSLEDLPSFEIQLRRVAEMTAGSMPATAESIHDFLRGLGQLLDGNRNAEFGTFRTWFGRGQQYVSFLKTPTAR